MAAKRLTDLTPMGAQPADNDLLYVVDVSASSPKERRAAYSNVLAGVLALSKVTHKLDATADPTADDDSTSGYGPGSFWLNITDDKAFICLDGTATAAVWFLIGSADMEAVVDGFKGVNEQTGTAYTAVASDAGKVIFMNNASANTVDIDNSVFSAGDIITIVQKGAGATTIQGTATLNKPSSKTAVINEQYGQAAVVIETGGASTVGYLDGNLGTA